MTRTLSTRGFVVAALVVTLLLGGAVSFYASAHPDGLEKVATETGFIDEGRDSATADSPMSDYATKGVDNDRLSGGLAGVVGIVTVLLVAGGLAYVVRRRSKTTTE